MFIIAIAIHDFNVFANLRNHALNGVFPEDARFIDANTKIGYNTTPLKLIERAVLNLCQQQSARYRADVKSCNTF